MQMRTAGKALIEVRRAIDAKYAGGLPTPTPFPKA